MPLELLPKSHSWALRMALSLEARWKGGLRATFVVGSTNLNARCQITGPTHNLPRTTSHRHKPTHHIPRSHLMLRTETIPHTPKLHLPTRTNHPHPLPLSRRRCSTHHHNRSATMMANNRHLHTRLLKLLMINKTRAMSHQAVAATSPLPHLISHIRRNQTLQCPLALKRRVSWMTTMMNLPLQNLLLAKRRKPKRTARQTRRSGRPLKKMVSFSISFLCTHPTLKILC
jgi:hypothetical protein